MDEAATRLENALEMFGTAAEAEQELYASGATYMDDIERLTLNRLAEDDFCFAIPFLLQVWFAFSAARLPRPANQLPETRKHVPVQPAVHSSSAFKRVRRKSWKHFFRPGRSRT